MNNLLLRTNINHNEIVVKTLQNRSLFYIVFDIVAF